MNTHFKQIIRSSYCAFALLILTSSIVFGQDCGQADFTYTIYGNIFKLVGKSTLNDSAKYDWTFGNGKSGGDREVKAEYEKNGEYEICMKVKSGNCTLSKCKIVKVNGNSTNSCGLIIKYDFRIDGTTGIFISNSNLDNTKYQWQIAGQNKIYEGREVKIPFEKAGIYEVCVTAFTNANCKVQECKRVEIGSACNLGADFTYNVDSTGVVKVFGKSTAGETAKYYWSFSNGKSAEGKDAKIQFEKTGEYQICLKVLKPAVTPSNVQSCTQAICKNVKVNIKTTPCNLKVETESKVDGLTGIFQAKSNVDNTKYVWYVAGQPKQYEGREVKIPFEKAGIYEVCVSAFTNANCKVQECKRVEIGSTCNLGADYTFDVDSTGVVKVFGKSTAGETAKYYWSFSNGKSAEGKDAKIQFEKTGEYQICLKVLKPAVTASNDQSCTQTICKNVKVNIKTTPCNLKVETESKVDGLTGVFQAKSNVDNTKYVWFVTSQNMKYEGREVKIPFEKPGVYEVCVVGYAGICEVKVCKRVEIASACNLGADFTFDVDSTGVVKVFGKSTAGETAKYYWSFSNGVPADGKEAKIQYSKSGEYQICLKVLKLSPVSSIQPCTQSVCKTVKVNINTPPCNLRVEMETKTEGLTGIFQAKSNLDNTKYVWYIANKKYEGREVKILFEKPGAYEVCVVGYTTNCEVKVCKRVEISNAITCNLGADFTFESENDIVKAKATSNPGSNVKYYWTFGNGVSFEGKEAVFKFDKPGDYQLCLMVTRTSPSNVADTTNCTQTVCKKINIKIQQAECKLSPDFTYKSEGNIVTFSGKSSDEKAKYYWYAKDIKMELTGKDVRFQFEKAASYEVCMIVVNGAETCKDQICKKISVGNRINVFPNPTANVLNIAVDEIISRVTIYDQFNKVVNSGNLNDSYGNIDISQLNSGLYTVTVQLNNGEVMAKKFYKQ